MRLNNDKEADNEKVNIYIDIVIDLHTNVE